MRRRDALAAVLAAALAPRIGAAAEAVQRFATAWRVGEGDDHRVGIVEVDTDRLRVAAEVPVPSRAHGLLARSDGGFLAVANRPGDWMFVFDAEGNVVQRLDARTEAPRHTLNGHVESSADGRWLYTTETDPRDGTGWIAVRDALTLRRIALWRSGGIDAHQLRVDRRDGALFVANGGIVRDARGRKVDGAPIDASLARLDPASGRITGQWRVQDGSISLRHIAWSADGARLGVALQAEHDDPAQRLEAPVLAVWQGDRLHVPSRDARAAGYAGDIAAGPEGGFVLSAQKALRVLWWSPERPERFTPIADLTEPCGLAATEAGQGVWISAGRGLARWHRVDAAAMQAWPARWAPDNHVIGLQTS